MRDVISRTTRRRALEIGGLPVATVTAFGEKPVVERMESAVGVALKSTRLAKTARGGTTRSPLPPNRQKHGQGNKRRPQACSGMTVLGSVEIRKSRAVRSCLNEVPPSGMIHWRSSGRRPQNMSSGSI